MHETDALDVLIVQVTPNKNTRTPTSKSEIVNRLEQITFNATLNAEIEALKLAASIRATPKLRELRIDRIAAEDEIEGLAAHNAADLGWSFLEKLRGRRRSARGGHRGSTNAPRSRSDRRPRPRRCAA